MRWDLSCPDWEARMREGRSLVPELPLFEGPGERAVQVFNRLRLSDVPGTPYLGEAAGDWFRDIVRAMFGSLDPVTRQRMIREVFLLVPKKNSKTTNGALMMLTALLVNSRPKAPFIMTAPVQDVSDLAFSAAAGAIALDPVLSKKLHIREHLKTIVHRQTGATLEIMTFDPSVVTGQKAAGILIDELHVVAKMAKASSAVRQLRGGMLPFPEAFMAFITTQSEEAPSGVFKAELIKARSIRDGKRVGSMLPVLYEFPREMQKDPTAWRNPKNWHMVTPNAGRSITVERLEEEFDTAQSTGEQELREWASQHLNVEIGLAILADGWAGAEQWESAGNAPSMLAELLARCEVVDVGIDGGGLDDLLGLAVVGREKATGKGPGKWLAWTHAWAHPIVLQRRKKEAERLRDFQKDGDLTIIDRIGEDVDQLVALIVMVLKSGKLDKIGVDPHGIGSILDGLIEAEVPKELVVGISQGWKMTGAIKTTERKLAEGALLHSAQPMMEWCVGNAKVEPRGNAVIITKQASGSAKIDPLMALINAVTLLSLNPEPPQKDPQLLFL